MKKLKMTPQELTDSMDAYLAMDDGGTWYAYKEKPMFDYFYKAWLPKSSDYMELLYTEIEFSDEPENSLCEPKKENK